MKYHIWTEGCQMNVADSQRVASALERIGFCLTHQAGEADVIVLNTCVVRQSAENKAYGRLFSLKPLKEQNPHLVINLMGCLVGVKGYEQLQKRFPFVDVFSPPSDPGPLIAYLTQEDSQHLEYEETQRRFSLMDDVADSDYVLQLPAGEQGKLVSAHVPVVLGCSHGCTFCIIPYRRGIERSRPASTILTEVHALVAQGVREVTFLGQIVDQYGKAARTLRWNRSSPAARLVPHQQGRDYAYHALLGLEAGPPRGCRPPARAPARRCPPGAAGEALRHAGGADLSL